MNIQNQVDLIFHGLDIFEVFFKAFQPITEGISLSLRVTPKVHYPADNTKLFKIFMEVQIFSEAYIIMNVSGVGHFELSENISQEIKKQYININAPAITFPYIRSFITTLSSNCGTSINRIILPPQFFQGDLEEITEESSSIRKISLEQIEIDSLLDDSSTNKSSGGWQSLILKLRSQFNRDTNEIVLYPDDLERIPRYAFDYKDGGWQLTLKKIFSRVLGDNLGRN